MHNKEIDLYVNQIESLLKFNSYANDYKIF